MFNLFSKLILRKLEILPVFIIGGHILVDDDSVDSPNRKETASIPTEAVKKSEKKLLNITCPKTTTVFP